MATINDQQTVMTKIAHLIPEDKRAAVGETVRHLLSFGRNVANYDFVRAMAETILESAGLTPDRGPQVIDALLIDPNSRLGENAKKKLANPAWWADKNEV